MTTKACYLLQLYKHQSADVDYLQISLRLHIWRSVVWGSLTVVQAAVWPQTKIFMSLFSKQACQQYHKDFYSKFRLFRPKIPNLLFFFQVEFMSAVQ